MPGEKYTGERRMRLGTGGRLVNVEKKLDSSGDRPALRSRRDRGSNRSFTPKALTKRAVADSSGVSGIKNPRKDENLDSEIKTFESPGTSRSRARRSNSKNLRKDDYREASGIIQKAFPEIAEVYGGIQNAINKLAADLEGPKGNLKFPALMMSLAIIKDLSDMATVTFSAPITSILFGIYLWFWLRANTSMSGTYFTRKLVLYLAPLLADAVPLLSFVPFAVLTVLLVHYQKTKTVRLMMAAYEELSDKIPGLSKSR